MHTVLTIHNIPYSQILAIIFSKKTLICTKIRNRRKKVSKKERIVPIRSFNKL